MRKTIIDGETGSEFDEREWLDLERLARVEITSEEPTHPIDSALKPGGGLGWRASAPGKQLIRLFFDQPQRLRRILLVVNEQELPRTQEFVLRCAQDHGKSFHEIVRQQYNFHPPGTISEREEYNVDLPGVTTLELEIVPDIGGSAARASLARLRLA